MKRKLLLLLVTVFLLPLISQSQCGPLATPYNQNNGQDGIMFDVVAITSIEITSWDVNCGGATQDFEIYYRAGTHVGFQNNAAGWNLIATANGVTGAINVATPIPAPFSVVLCAGDVGAFYIASSNAATIDYTNGVAVGNVIAVDANLQILTGTGKDYPFAASFQPRSPNVTAHYNCLALSCCAAQGITANIGACLGGVYSTTGTFTFINPPGVGQLIVEDCNGIQQIINPPFVSPINYTLTNQIADGNNCDITAYFTSDPLCTINTGVYVAPMCACNIDAFNVAQGLCQQSTDTYGYTGDVSFTSPPASGTLIVEVDNGTNIYDTIITLPFISPQTWSISGIPSDGAASTITVYFSADPACSMTINMTAPTTCFCGSDIGTFTPAITGSSTNNYVLCYGDQIDINSNNDWTGGGEQFTIPPQAPPPVYDPGVYWFMYSCPPTVAITPDPLLTPWLDDPCFLAAYNTLNFSDLNDMAYINSYPAGTFTNNTIYWVPITMYSTSTGTVSFVTGNSLPCYEMGTPYAVQYLPQFTSSYTEACLTGIATATLNGGLPAVDGSLFTASNLLPATASFTNNTAADGGNIVISGLQGGEMWSFTVNDGNGCPYTVAGGPFPPLEDPGFSYAPSSWCTADPAANPLITGVVGGTFTSAPAGLTINAASGQITPSSSIPGTYNVTYTTPGACFDDSTFVVNVSTTPTVDPVLDQTVCEGINFSTVTYIGSAGSVFNWTNDNINSGLVAAGTGDIPSFTGATTGGQQISNITVTPSAGSCVGTPESFILTVNPQEIATFNYPASAWCTSDVTQNANITGTIGGTFTAIPAGLSLNAATGNITPATSTPGTYDITYTTTGICFAATTVTIDINEMPTVNPILDQTVCVGSNFSTVSFTGPTAGTTYSWSNDNTNTGLTAIGTGDIASFVSTTPGGTQVSNIDVTPSTAFCTGPVVSFILTVNDLDDPSFNYPGGLTYCQSGTDPAGNITGMTGGTFSFTASAGGPFLDMNTTTANITLATSNIGTYDITYNTAGAPTSLCPQTSTLTLVVTDAPVSNFSFLEYCADATDPMPDFVNDDAGIPFAATGSGGVFTVAPAGLTINAATGLVDLAGSTAGTYTVTNTINIPGCAISIATDDIIVNELPDATIAGSTTICPSDPLPNIDINITAGIANWSIDYTVDGAAANANSVATLYTISGAAIGTYDLVSITDGNGCTNSISGQVVIDTYPTPSVDLLSAQSVCIGDNLQIQTFSGSPVGVTFDWTNSGTDVGFGLGGSGQIGGFTGLTAGQADITVTPYGGNTTVASPLGCVGPTENFTVTVNPIPSPTFDADIYTGCEPLVVNFTNLTANGSNCIWNFGDGTTVSGCAGVSNSYMAGTYDVTLTVTNTFGCTGSTTTNQFIEAYPVPVASFSFSPQDITVENTEVDFTNASMDATNYDWDFNDNTSNSNMENPTHIFPTEPGEYLVTLTASSSNGACVDTYQQLVIIDDVIIFHVPNIFTPDGDEFNESFTPVFTSGFDAYDFHLTIFNRWGEQIFESYDATKGWNGHYGDGGLVSDGVYIWQVEFRESMSDKRHEHRGHVTVLK